MAGWLGCNQVQDDARVWQALSRSSKVVVKPRAWRLKFVARFDRGEPKSLTKKPIDELVGNVNKTLPTVSNFGIKSNNFGHSSRTKGSEEEIEYEPAPHPISST